jgi:large subunit ribosomal protein LX
LSENKVFRITGEVNKKKFFEPMRFSKEVLASKKEHALEKIYTEIGSRHRAKRKQIIIHNIEEIRPMEEEIE